MFFGPKLIFCSYFQFYCWHTFYNQMGGYPVSLSSIGAKQQICGTFSWSLFGKHQKTHFFDVFWPKTFLIKVGILLLEHLLQSNWRRPCIFELNRSKTANLRTVFAALSETPKNPFLRCFLAQNVVFCAEVAFLNTVRPFTIKWAAIL